MKEIEILPGVKLTIDPAKFNVEAALRLPEIPEGDLRITLDLNLVNLIEKTDQKVQSLVILRTK